jgi:hypothetical protein
MEGAQNGVRRGLFLTSIGGARRTLCASMENAQNGVRRDIVLFRWSWCAPHPLRFYGTRAKRSTARYCSVSLVVVRAAPFALLWKTRKTEYGASCF